LIADPDAEVSTDPTGSREKGKKPRLVRPCPERPECSSTHRIAV